MPSRPRVAAAAATIKAEVAPDEAVSYGTDSREANCLVAGPAFDLRMRRRKHELAFVDEGHHSHCYLQSLLVQSSKSEGQKKPSPGQ